MKTFLKKNAAFDRSRVTALVGAGAIVLLLALNLLLTSLVYPLGLYGDMTYEEFYTPTDRFEAACDAVFLEEQPDGTLPEVEAIFCDDPDRLNANTVSRVTYLLLMKLQQRYSNFHVSTVNVKKDPTAVMPYKTTSQTSITSTDLILSYGGKSRVLALESLWVATEDDTYYSYNGEYRLASALYSLMAVNRPTAYFLSGHGETVYETDAEKDTSGNQKTEAMYNLLLDRGLQVKTLNITEVDEIPEDCVLLILNNPTADFSADNLTSFSEAGDLEKIDRYMVTRQGAMMVAKDPKRRLPQLEAYLREWGFVFTDALVKDTEHYVDVGSGDATHVVAAYDTQEDSYGYSIYGSVASIDSAAGTVFSDAGYINCAFRDGMMRGEDGTTATRVFASFLTTHDSARAFAYDADSGEYTSVLSDRGAHILAATGSRMSTDAYTAEETFSYVFCAASADAFSSEYLANASYANYDVMSLLVENISRVDVYADIDLGGESLNSENAFGKVIMDTAIHEKKENVYAADGSLIKTCDPMTAVGRGVFVFFVALIPMAAAALGVVICIRRRFL